ncbi:FecR family protein [Cellulophaga lytica]|uniref:Anti-FecI sigma factor, FecR n=1 Tax=Cellulophaga lytica (strain ATCC 23178 / DSM 7489 / JCM 8516 / NBRC 14961 / NCIMB 1423 / VKM B-1433 / Cy l20) TaxID=867900 RepID=F0RF28_CELLC|nr:FecR family protein [Cellulophaga lytica]ADY30003.1 anti-FecI sigma factor, FecR [Cellulophaga lytica DSM 7489]APU10863.1 histidine kinase [Cellulophaga lytica]WQG75833.1 FecR family protein [Cellulophaga lytica]SNQ42508.1 anti-sigma factor [Cellulophaga lytica]
MQENYLAKWLNNELTEEEIIQFKKTEEYASYQKIITASSKLKAPEFDQEKALQAINKKRNTNKQTKVIKLNPFKKYISIAAAVILLFGLGYFYTTTLEQTVSTDYAQNNELILPDNSEVILNAESKIAYNKNKWDQKRDVSLEGEAFFKVAKGEKFTVTTNQGVISVLGTQFNVETRANFFEVTCYEGLVNVNYNGKDYKVPGGTSFMVINGNVAPLSHVKTLVPSWTLNESTFKSIPLEFVFNELQRQFNLTVTTKNVNTKQLYTGSFNNKDLDLALKSISIPSKISYTLEENKVLFYAEK